MNKLLTFFIVFLSCYLLAAQTSISAISSEKQAIEIHQEVITIDTHNDINIKNFTEEVNYTQDLDTQVNLPKMEKGGIDVSWLIVYTGQGDLNENGYEEAFENAMSKFDAIHRLVNDLAPEQIELALSASDVERIIRSGKKVAMIGVENAYPIGTDLRNIEKFYKLGARYMSLSHNGHSQFCDSNTGERDDVWLHGGLSDLGRQAVKEMNRLGMMIDLSHPSKEANKQVLELTKAPVIASHSSARALCDHSRNLDDELLLMIRENGGVVQTVAFGQYVNMEKNQANREASKALYQEVAREMGIEYKSIREIMQLEGEDKEAAFEEFEAITKAAEGRKGPINEEFPPVDVKDFVDHVDYMVGLMGIDHVGISSDFDGGGGVLGWQNAAESLNVTKELVKRGYTKEQIAKLWGLNLLRVLSEVETIAKGLN